MSFRRRPFPEVLDNLLTSTTQGVAAETHPFPPPGATAPPYRHTLQQPPVATVISVYGSRDGQPVLFRQGADYQLLEDQPILEWQEGAQLPDLGTLLQVNYYPQSSQPVLTDLLTGSVLRTLAESVALEIARLYAQLEVVYQSGFVDTATDRALDNVVALLGINRVKGGRPAGVVEFTRSPGSGGVINIPAGTRIIIPDGNVEYETTESLTLGPGQTTLAVVARDLEPNDPLPADTLTVLPIPIAGIASVTNPAPTTITTQDETDVELRTRAKNFLHGSERATLGSIKEAIARQDITADVVEVQDTPGTIEIIPQAESLSPELFQRLNAAIATVKPAGIVVKLQPAQPPRKINLELRLTTLSGLLEQDLRAAQRSVRDKVADYLERLPTLDEGSINRIVGLVLSIPGIEDVQILSANDDTGATVLDEAGQLALSGFATVLGELRIADPNLPTLLDIVVTYPEGELPPDTSLIQPALSGTLTYLNDINASDAVETTRQELSYGKLLYVVPLPNKPGALPDNRDPSISLEAYDNAVASNSPLPTLPDQTTISPYTVKFIFTLASGLSQILLQDADTYTLTTFERLSLNSVEVQAEGDNDQI